jgi:hypothetical protein
MHDVRRGHRPVRRVVVVLVLVVAALSTAPLLDRARAQQTAPAATYVPAGQCFGTRAPTPEETAAYGVPADANGVHARVLWAAPGQSNMFGQYFPGCVPPGWVHAGHLWSQGDSPYRFVDCTADLEPNCFWLAGYAPGGGGTAFEWSRKAFAALAGPGGSGPGTGSGPGPGGGGPSDTCPEPRAPSAGVRVVAESANRRLTTVQLGDSLLGGAAGTASAVLQEAGARHGFEVSAFSGGNPDGETENTWLEDLLVPLSDGSFLVPGDLHLDAARASTEAAGLGVFGGGRPTDAVMAMATANGLQVRRSTVFVEGGNLLTMRGPDGAPLVVVGRSSLHVAGFQRQLQGCIAADADIDQVLQHARAVLATELGVAPSQVVDVPDGGGHVDMMVRPGPDGVVLVDDPAKVLDALRAAQQDPTLSTEQRELLDQITPTDAELPRWQDRSDLMSQVSAGLERAGMRVVPVPGVVPGLGLRFPGANFMNGVMATDAKGQLFYLTNDTKTDRPGRDVPALERAFQAAVAPLGVQVDFLPTSNLIRRGGGLDCVTVEHAVEPAP